MPVYWHNTPGRERAGRTGSDIGVGVRVALAAVALVYLAGLGLGACVVWSALP